MLSFIWALCHQKALATYPPTQTGRPFISQCETSPAYLVLQLIRFTRFLVTKKSRELLPHVFTLTPTNRGGNFLWHLLLACSFLLTTFPLRSMMPFAVLTFLDIIRCRDNCCCKAQKYIFQSTLLNDMALKRQYEPFNS